MDFATGKVSNKLILIGLALSFTFSVILGEKNGFSTFLIGTITPILLLIFIFMIGGIGAGDVKLFAVIGGFIGYQGVIWCIIASFIIGAVISVGKILFQKNLIKSFKSIGNYAIGIIQSKEFQIIEKEKGNTIHFTLPILLSLLCYIGGNI